MARRLFLGSKLFQRPFRVQLGDQCLEFYKTCLHSSLERLLLDRQRQEQHVANLRCFKANS